MRILFVMMGVFLFSPVAMAENIIPEMLKAYEAAGASHFDAKAGSALWHKEYPAPEGADSPKPRSCQACHGVDLRKNGAHIRTGKVIDPMALSVNPQRFSEAKKIRKWFRRNCKWVMGRVCTAQEKGDILTYLQQQ
ncbi:MAG: DUF1924 domain-containing protein [Mariprofundaceae bacterium]|nr:DUF1924 domain-containing protein [Mariprofundaceae bacterium]